MTTTDATAPAPTPVPTPAPAAATPRRLRMLLRPLALLLRAALWLLITLLLVLLLTLGFALGTRSGLQLTLAAVEDFAPGLLRVGRAEGRVLGRIELEDLALRLPGFELDLGELVLDWSPTALLTGTLRVAELTGRDIDIGLAPSTSDEPLTLPEIRLPLGIDLDRGLVERLRWRTLGAPPEAALVLDRLELSATALAERLDIRRLSTRLSQPDLTADASGQARLVGNYPMTLDLAWRFAGPPPNPAPAALPAPTPPDATPVAPAPASPTPAAPAVPALILTGSGQVRGDLTDLTIEHRIDGALEARLAARLRDALTRPAWDGSLTVSRVDLAALAPDASALDLRADLATQGTLDDARLTGRILATPGVGLEPGGPLAEQVGPLTATLDLRLAGQVLTIQALRLRPGLPTDEATDGAAPASTGPSQDPTGPRLDLIGTVGLTDPANPLLDLRGDWADLRWPLTGAPRVAAPSGALTAVGDLTGADLTLTTRVQAAPLPETAIGLTARASRERIDLTALTLDTLDGRLTLAGGIDLTPALAWQLALTGQNLNPGLLQPGLAGRVGLKADTAGNLADGFGFQVRADAQLRDWPGAILTAAGTGNTSAVSLDSLALETLGGRIDGQGRVALAPAVAWEATLTLANLDPGRLAPDWPGRIGGTVRSEGRLTPAGPDLTARISDFGGQLRGFPVRLDGDLALAGTTLTLNRLEAGSGSTRLSASGRAGERLDLRFSLQSPDLAALLPGARGSLAADGRVAGTAAAPTLTLTLNATNAGLGANGVGGLTAEVSAGLARDTPLRLALRATDLTAGGQRFDTLALNADGAQARHRVTAALAGEALKADLTLTGALADNGAWRGTLERLDLAPAGFGAFRLQRPPPLSFDNGRVAAGPLCLTDGKGSNACVGFNQSAPDRFTATLDAPRLDLALLAPLLPKTMQATGFVRANGRFEGSGGRLTGGARLDLPEAALTLDLTNQQERLVFNGARLDLDAAGGGLTTRLALPVAGIGRVGAEVGLPGLLAGGGGTAALRGTVTARVESFARLAPLVPDVTGLTGALNADLTLGGTLTAPAIGGELALRGLGLRAPLIGLEVQNFDFIASGRGARAFTLSGGGLVGGKRLDLAGNAAGLLGDRPVLDLSIRGDRLKVADTREYFALVSLDLAAALAADGLQLTGGIKVPEARIMPRGVAAGAVRPSPDIIVKGSEAAGPPLPITIDIRTRLGDKVQIEAFGLRGRLTGDLRVLKQPGGELTGDGQLEVVDGTFRVSLPGLGLVTAIGEPLKIEQGIVNFAGTSLTDPGLVLNAVRQGGDLTAGVQVLGTLRNPRLAFFSDSDPNMSQAEITKYLVTGIPPRRDGDAADERAVSFGTYVAPKLFVEYESSLGDQADRVKLRYDLNNRVELQTETGSDGQGGDIFFKWEN